METEIDYEYLQKLIDEYSVLKEKISYIEVNDNDYDISYMTKKEDIRINLFQGLHAAYWRKRYKCVERTKIRKDSKNHCKIYRKDGLLVRVDCYLHGKIDVVFIAYYEDDKVILYPFWEDGKFYPTYAYVTKYDDGVVVEEYCVQDHQIVYDKYLYDKEDTVGYISVNYFPNSKYLVYEKQLGTILLQPELDYRIDQYSTWRDN